MLPMELLMVPTPVVAYHRILRHAQSFRRIAAVSFCS
jgi:hypothetical protein